MVVVAVILIFVCACPPFSGSIHPAVLLDSVTTSVSRNFGVILIATAQRLTGRLPLRLSGGHGGVLDGGLTGVPGLPPVSETLALRGELGGTCDDPPNVSNRVICWLNCVPESNLADCL